MKEVYIDGKKYFQQEDADIARLPHFYHSKDMLKDYRPERLRRVDTSNSEAIVRSANIDEIAETSRND